MEIKSRKFLEVVDLYIYNRYKYHHQKANDIVMRIKKEHFRPQAIEYIRLHFGEQSKKIYQREQKNYLSIFLYIIQLHMLDKEVLFIDRCKFYRKQFIILSLISKNKNVDYKYTPFEPKLDVMFHLILGVTNKRILSCPLISKKLKVISYFLHLQSILASIQSLPNIIVIYICLHQMKRQWQKLCRLTEKLRQRGKLIFFLPSRQCVPNVMKGIEFFLKLYLLNHINYQNDELIFREVVEKQISNLLKMIDKKEKLSWLTRVLWRNDSIQRVITQSFKSRHLKLFQELEIDFLPINGIF